MNVTLGSQWLWPKECPCCLADADDKLEVKKSRGVFLVVAAYERVLTLKVPYCKGCKSHARRFEGGTVGRLLYPTAMVLFCAFMVGILGLAWLGESSRGAEFRLMVVFPMVVTTLFVAFRIGRRLSLSLDNRHAARGSAVTIDDWTGQTVDLACANPKYGARLEAVNQPQGFRSTTMRGR